MQEVADIEEKMKWEDDQEISNLGGEDEEDEPEGMEDEEDEEDESPDFIDEE